MATNIGLDKHPSTNSKPSVLLSPALHPGFSPDATQAILFPNQYLAHRDKNMTRMGFTFGHPYDKCYITSLIF